MLYCLNIVGMDISDIDLINIERFTTRIIALADYRAQLSEYLTNKMMNVAPNLTSLIGEQVHFYQQIRSNILCIVVCCLLCVSLSVDCCLYLYVLTGCNLSFSWFRVVEWYIVISLYCNISNKLGYCRNNYIELTIVSHHIYSMVTKWNISMVILCYWLNAISESMNNKCSTLTSSHVACSCT